MAANTACSPDAGPRPTPLSTPICRSTTFAAATAAEHSRLLSDRSPLFYQRFGAPNERRLEEVLAALDGGESAAVFASGMAAIATTLLELVPPRSHVVVGRAVFEQTARVLDWLVDATEVAVTWVDARSVEEVERALRPGATKLVYVETPSNPLLHVVDVAEVARATRRAGARLVVDATFASPVLSRPLAHGAQLVVHSLTKLVNGHSDAMGGAVVGDLATVAAIRRRRELLGGVIDPQAAWLVERGLKTLRLRAARVSESALALARELADHPAVAELRYPFHPDHEGYGAAIRQMTGGGPVLCFRLHGGVEAARALVARLRLVRLATSLGGVDSAIELPYDLDWSDSVPQASEQRSWLRLSVGLEEASDLIADLRSALAAVAPPPNRSPSFPAPAARREGGDSTAATRLRPTRGLS
jgi:cystathionine beta-lyase/cystathionine gamma-synthase